MKMSRIWSDSLYFCCCCIICSFKSHMASDCHAFDATTWISRFGDIKGISLDCLESSVGLIRLHTTESKVKSQRNKNLNKEPKNVIDMFLSPEHPSNKYNMTRINAKKNFTKENGTEYARQMANNTFDFFLDPKTIVTKYKMKPKKHNI